MNVPIEWARRRRRRAANVEVNKGIVVGLAMQVLRLEDHAIAVEYEVEAEAEAETEKERCLE